MVGPDGKCQDVLQQTARAMKKDYSRLLLNEWVLPDRNYPVTPATMDINMMALCSSAERSERQWRTLLSSIGLEIVKIWSIGIENESLIEAILH